MLAKAHKGFSPVFKCIVTARHSPSKVESKILFDTFVENLKILKLTAHWPDASVKWRAGGNFFPSVRPKAGQMCTVKLLAGL